MVVFLNALDPSLARTLTRRSHASLDCIVEEVLQVIFVHGRSLDLVLLVSQAPEDGASIYSLLVCELNVFLSKRLSSLLTVITLGNAILDSPAFG